MTKFTPGPWQVKMSNNATPYIMHKQGFDRTDIEEVSSIVCIMPAEIRESFNSLANANLIAAAPDMFDTLNIIETLADIGACGDGDVAHETLKRIKRLALISIEGVK